MYTGSQKILWTTKQSIVWNSNLSGSPCKCYYIQAREKMELYKEMCLFVYILTVELGMLFVVKIV